MSNLNLAILDSLAKHKRQKYLVGQDETTYGQLEMHVKAFSAYLEDSGLQGERLIIVTINDKILLTSFFAALLAGVTSVILDPAAPLAELETLIEAADARGIVADASLVTQLEKSDAAQALTIKLNVYEQSKSKTKSRFRLFSKGETPSEDHHDRNDISGVLAAFADQGLKQVFSDENLTTREVSEEDIAYILFTSGTTSRPKGVMISHRALYAQMNTFVNNYGVSDRSNVMNLLPFHHTDGLTQGAVMCLLAGSCLVRPYRFTPDVLPQMISDLYKYSVSHLVTVPSVLALSQSLDGTYDDAFQFPEFEFVISTAAYFDAGLWQQTEDRFGIQIVNVYGLTETVCETMYCGPDPQHRRVGSVGKPIDSFAKIVDPDGRELDDDQNGELMISGDHLMSGYFNNAEATEAVLKDGWFATGDLAMRDTDGFYFIVGRKKDLIISGGMNIYPEDVNAILRDIPGIIDAVTFGLPDQMWGERAVSCIICDKSVDPGIERITEEFLQRGSKQKLPRQIMKLEAFPRGPAGKVVMREVQELFLSESKKAPQHNEAAIPKGDVPERIYSVVSSILKCPTGQLNPQSNPESVKSWTSLSHVEMMLALEAEFAFKFSPREIMRFQSLGDAIEIVQQRTAA